MAGHGKTPVRPPALTLEAGGRRYAVAHGAPADLSIPLDFHGPQPNLYGVPPAAARAYEDGGFVGDTRRGGGCNFESVAFIPHCHGTHTECVGHLTLDRISIRRTLQEGLIPATLITVAPQEALATPDTYTPPKAAGDRMITHRALATALAAADAAFLGALVIRTLPNDASKRHRRYPDEPAPFLSHEAMGYIVSLGVRHLLLDLPSVDRAFDEGLLSAHHIFWEMEQESHTAGEGPASSRTITELIYVDHTVPDGRYLLDLQIAPFVADAAPSRPVLYPVTPL